MKNNTFLKSTLILLIGGIFGKLIGFILKIIITRNLGSEGMGLFSMLSPTTSLLSTIAIFSYPNILSKLISEDKRNIKDLFISIIPISILINITFIFIMYLSSNYLSYYLVKSNELVIPIICISLTMPFISISSIIKGYFWGKQNMFPYMLSNFIEQVTRFILIILFISKMDNLIYKISFIILINIIGEIISQIVMIVFIPKFSLKNIHINKSYIKEIYKLCIPSTSSKLIGSLSFFLEPIVLTNILIYVGYSKEYIVYEYGILNGYSLSILLMSAFFTQNMSTSLIPEISKYYGMGNLMMCKKRLKQIVSVSLFIGILSTIIIVILPKFFLNILYNTNEGVDYIRLLSPFIPLFYIENPLINALQAIGYNKKLLKITSITSIIRLFTIVLFSKLGMYTLILSIIINLILSTYLYYREIKNALNVHFICI